ncbi:MAG: biotin--[acetyl-CoA-carboxylase] ligase [Deltaproteobacteria bacterium RIFOXYA12_FULL_61_11]|nr:MAG: biotin--[acetyl-CoA-carboxylase] ligase [Deltaproteobacteria bacterium RIFOXYA12_FULL_61_11]
MVGVKAREATFLWYDEVDSTNELATSLAESGGLEGTVVLAGKQRVGRGRYGRRWASPEGNLYLSLIVRPTLSAQHGGLLTLLPALALCEVLEGMFQLRPQLKWPNDVLLDGRKLAGCLLEGKVRGERYDYVILGLGVNTACSPEPQLEPFRRPVVSLAEAGAREVSNRHLAEAVVSSLLTWYQRLERGDACDLLTAAEARLYRRGCEVSLDLPGGKTLGTILGLDESGGLLVEFPDGRRQVCRDADVQT